MAADNVNVSKRKPMDFRDRLSVRAYVYYTRTGEPTNPNDLKCVTRDFVEIQTRSKTQISLVR